MATVTKPMVLDETHRLTSDQSKNIADVISEGLSNIALGNTSYTKAETDALIAALDYSDTAVSGSYVTEVDETDGVISVTRESADATPTDSSTKLVTSGGVKTALDLKQNTLTAGDGIDITSDVVSVDAEEKTTTSTFNTVNGGLLSSCVVTLEPVQSGSGTPSPNNIRPITGHTTADIEITDGIDTDTYSTALNQTVYGGTVDLVSGEMTITHGYRDLGSLTYNYESANQRFIGFVNGIQNTTVRTMPIVCDMYETIDDGSQYDPSWNNVIYNSGNTVVIHNHAYTDATALQTAMSGHYMAYILASPVTVQLSKQQIEAFVGANTITCPLTGQSITEADYREVMGYDSVKQSIEIKVSLSSLGTIEDSNLSSQAYSSGDYFVRNGKMCKATTAIAQGATLTEGTNYTAYTLAEILKLIENA